MFDKVKDKVPRADASLSNQDSLDKQILIRKKNTLSSFLIILFVSNFCQMAFTRVAATC